MFIRTIVMFCILSGLTSKLLWADPVSPWERRIEAMVDAGLTLATLGGGERDNSTADFPYKRGFIGGAALSYRINQFLFVQAGADFVTKGYRADTGIVGSSNSMYLAYVEFPILVGAEVTITEAIATYAELGVAPAILLDADLTLGGGRSEVNRLVEPFDAGMLFGIGAAINIGRDIGSITINAHYNFGLLNWDNHPSGNNGELLNRAFYITVGYRTDLATLGRLFGGSDGAPPAETAPPATTPADVTQPATVEPAPAPPLP